MSEYGLDDTVINIPLTQPPPKQTTSYKHPTCVFFHFVFKGTCLLFYFIHPAGFVISFIFCILCMAFDFYTVKNISGRLLVGLRWWNDMKEDGTSEWVFESVKDQRSINQAEATLFWISLYAMPLVWGILCISCFFSLISNFQWFPVPIAALSLSLANVFGYMKCAKDQQTKIQGLAQSYAQSYIAKTVMSRATSFFG